MKKRLSILTLLTSLFAQVTAAEENNFAPGSEFADFFGEETLVSIATGTHTPISKAPSVASVINAETISSMGVTHLFEVLERIPGLHLMPSDLSRLDPVLSVRGIQTGFNPQILILLNGIELKHNYNGGLAFTFRMPVSNVSRIEVIRGPGSAVYGADAFSGVINIITRTAAENQQGAAGIRVGSFDSRDTWLRKGFVEDDFSVSFSLDNQTSDGDSGRIVNTDLQSTFDDLYGTSASEAPNALQTGYDVTNLQFDLSLGNWSWKNWYWKQDSAGVGQGGSLALDSTGYQNAEQFLTHLNYDKDLTNHFNFKADLSYLRTVSDSYFLLFPEGSTLPIGSDGNAFSDPFSGLVTFTDGYIGNPYSLAETTRLELAGIYSGYDNHTIRIASGWSQDKIRTEEYKNFGPGVIDGSEGTVDGTLTNVSGSADIYLQPQKRTAYFLSAQDQWQLNNDWSFTAGLRWDNYSDFGNTLNPRLALVWLTRHNLTTRLLYGTAFRAPSFSEQHLINNPAALGNPDLKPEEIETYELAFDYRPHFDTNLRLSLYSYTATDLIDTVTTGSMIQYQNIGNQDGYGAELEWDWKINPQLSLNANYAYQHATNADTNMPVANVPQHSTYIDLNYTLSPNWSGSLQHYWIGSREREEGDNRAKVSDYHWVNAKVTHDMLKKQVRLALIVKNLFDTYASEPSSSSIPDDYPLEGRSIWAEIEYRF
ncbi:TonB-dependent siderophore receptor [Neptuniibacter sp. 2_MG-2023]|uniref:TonB-dependent receptor plug domain-containing protein n=1 Tax=Neptuniibacter sp. 2_MG-2023 TaxID=3062671 RepID=UPI0026E27465|nr:TonB-dependent receptor [Neptuniibacter sp. 2_MG-2023]MDO6513970.1 TonB-dependent receptor [Neptuniibacter sp. 2_MG-2023]